MDIVKLDAVQLCLPKSYYYSWSSEPNKIKKCFCRPQTKRRSCESNVISPVDTSDGDPKQDIQMDSDIVKPVKKTMKTKKTKKGRGPSKKAK